MSYDIFVYTVRLPEKVHEMVCECNGGYTIYIDSALSHEEQVECYYHALKHIYNNDFERHDVQEIELRAHEVI